MRYHARGCQSSRSQKWPYVSFMKLDLMTSVHVLAPKGSGSKLNKRYGDGRRRYFAVNHNEEAFA